MAEPRNSRGGGRRSPALPIPMTVGSGRDESVRSALGNPREVTFWQWDAATWGVVSRILNGTNA